MKMTEMFPSNYLKKEDINGPTMLTIAKVAQEEISGDGGKELKAVIYWREKAFKAMICNKGNALTLCEAYGDDSENWTNKPAEVYVDPNVSFAGKRVGGLRLRIPRNHSPALWSFEEALTAAAKVGISADELKASLKNQGVTSYNREKCTPLVQTMIAAKNDERAFGEPPPGRDEESIPF